MFGIKKRKNEEKQFLEMLDYLLKDETVTPKEYKYLEKAKKRIERNEYYPRVLRDLTGELQPMALQSQLSKHVVELYLCAIHDYNQDNGWSGISFMSF